MSTLTKVSTRALRVPCPDCGTNEIYWGEYQGKRVLINRNYITRNTPIGVSIPTSFIHNCKGGKPQ